MARGSSLNKTATPVMGVIRRLSHCDYLLFSSISHDFIIMFISNADASTPTTTITTILID